MDEEKDQEEQELDFIRVEGTPTMMLLPARRYAFNVFKRDYKITIPRKGKYKDVDAAFFTDEDGEFDVFAHSEQVGGEVLFVPSISKIMFAAAKYPGLENDQAFVPIYIIVRENDIDVIGNVIQMVKEN